MAENGNYNIGNRAPIRGRYKINKLLGEGTFAKVYHACHIESGQSVAIKVIDMKMALDAGLDDQIKREIYSLCRVRHPYIVQLIEVMASKAKIYMVMEYVSGGELFKKLTKCRLTEEDSRKYFQQLISAVGFCHSRRVYHRDLKPENLLLDENGNLKVADFGLSTLSDQVSYTFCGTWGYLAPEVLSTKKTKKGYRAALADIWSCGVILFQMTVGCHPYDRRGKRRPSPKHLSSGLTQLLDRLLNVIPRTRITIAEIMKDKWFRIGFKRVNFYADDGQLCIVDDDQDDAASASNQSETFNAFDTTFPRPARVNVFDIISFSYGLDLSQLFGESTAMKERFVSNASVAKIISKLEDFAKVFKFTVRKEGCLVRLQGSRESVYGPLVITAEIFELTPSLLVVELERKGGDREKDGKLCYEEVLCYKELVSGLQNLVVEESSGASHLPSFTENPS